MARVTNRRSETYYANESRRPVETRQEFQNWMVVQLRATSLELTWPLLLGTFRDAGKLYDKGSRIPDFIDPWR